MTTLYTVWVESLELNCDVCGFDESDVEFFCVYVNNKLKLKLCNSCADKLRNAL